MPQYAFRWAMLAFAAFVCTAAAARAQDRPAVPIPPPPPTLAPATATPVSASSPASLPELSPTGSASPSPSPSASASPAPQPIVLERSRLALVPGATAVVGVSGGTGAIVVQRSAPNVDVRYDPLARTLTLKGRAPGNADVALVDDAGDAVILAVLVAPPAGVVPSDVTVELGGNVSPQFAAAKIREAISTGAQLRPGTHVDVRGATPGDALRPGDVLEASARVHVDGANAYVDVDGSTNVHLRVDTLAQLDPQILFYSDDPERLASAASGVLYRNTLDVTRPARAYVYHVASNATHDLYLVLRATAADARVQLLGYAAGPSDAFAYVGHVSTLQYLLARGSQQSALVTVSSDAPYVLRLGSRELRPGELVAGIFDVRVVSGGPVDLAVVSTNLGSDPLAVADGPELAGDGHGRRGEFDLTAVPPLALTYAAGAPDPPAFDIGAPTIPNLRAGGRALGGDYGALRNVTLQVSNPGFVPAEVYFYEVPTGGSATTTIWFTGDPKPTEIPCVIRPNRYTIRTMTLAPSETRVVTGTYMTDGTSSFPLQFGLTSTPPTPPPGPYSPDACNPHTPPPAPPVPIPTASP